MTPPRSSARSWAWSNSLATPARPPHRQQPAHDAGRTDRMAPTLGVGAQPLGEGVGKLVQARRQPAALGFELGHEAPVDQT